MLLHPTVADKTFLVTIGDRTVGGLCSRDPMVGPWQVPVADCATTLLSFDGYAGEAFAMGERSPIAVIDGPASGSHGGRRGPHQPGRRARSSSLSRVKLSANWMAAAGVPGRGRRALRHREGRGPRPLPAARRRHPRRQGLDVDAHDVAGRRRPPRRWCGPLSLIVTAFAPCHDVRGAWTPQLRTDRGETDLVFLDLAGGRMRLGGSILAQVFGQVGNEAPDLDDPDRSRASSPPSPSCAPTSLVLAYHDRSDGGLLVTLAEMAFAGRTGVALELSAAWSGPRPTPRTSWPRSSTRSWASSCS